MPAFQYYMNVLVNFSQNVKNAVKIRYIKDNIHLFKGIRLNIYLSMVNKSIYHFVILD